jgi:hypothetical protein
MVDTDAESRIIVTVAQESTERLGGDGATAGSGARIVARGRLEEVWPRVTS